MTATTTTADSSSAGAGSAPALVFSGVSFRYRSDRPAVLDGLDLTVAPGEVVALVGGNGSGKSTVARLSNGLLQPEAGRVLVGGADPADPALLWDVRARVGLLFQDPEDQIVGATVEDDVAFGLENLGVPRPEMHERVAEAVATVGLSGEEATEPHLLSGGQKQRLALAGVLVLAPSVLVLDEPTSMLDPAGRAEVLAAVAKLAGEGVAVLLITQHMEEALAADRLAALADGRVAWQGPPRAFFLSGAYRSFPLGRPAAMGLAEELGLGEGDERPLTEDELVAWLSGPERAGSSATKDAPGGESAVGGMPPASGANGAEPAAAAGGIVSTAPAGALRGVGHTYNRGTPFARRGLVGVDLHLQLGSVTALVGATASGKSTLLQLLAGLLAPDQGTVEVLGRRPPRAGSVGMVFQRPEAQLFAATVREDVGMAPRLQGLSEQVVEHRVDAALGAVGLETAAYGSRSPFALSLGEKRRVALAGVLSLDPPLLVLDEPGAGLDPTARRRLVDRLASWADREDRTLVLTSHDMEEVVRLADRVAVLAHGRLLAEGPATEVLGDAARLRGVGLRPPLAARVAERLGCDSDRCPVDAAGLRRWLRERGPGPDADGKAAGGAG